MKSAMNIALVAAVARNRVIGGNNQLLWRIKADLRHFRDLTVGKPVIMGRKTHLSIGRPLPNRDNIVVTRDPGFSADGIVIAHSLEEAFAKAEGLARERGTKDIMIAGGGEIYAQAMPRASALYITEVGLEPDGDALFPRIERAEWRETQRQSHPRGPDDDAAYSFVEYLRK